MIISRLFLTRFEHRAALLVTPVLHEGWDNVSGIFPAGAWYNFDTGAALEPRIPAQPLVFSSAPPVWIGVMEVSRGADSAQDVACAVMCYVHARAPVHTHKRMVINVHTSH